MGQREGGEGKEAVAKREVLEEGNSRQARM